MQFEEITYSEDGPIGTITLNRPHDGNMFTPTMCHEIRDCINEIRRETRTRVIVITGAGDKFFCIGGRKEGMEDTLLYAGVLPTLEMYEAIDKLQKPVIAMVNGFAVGGGNVLQVVCDITIAKESAVFRQVGPMMGSFDARLRHLVPRRPGRQEAREGDVVPQPQAHARARRWRWGLVNQSCRTPNCSDFTRKFALEIAERGAFALASIKAAFNARHGGVSRPVAHGARPAAARLPRDRRAPRAGRSRSPRSASPTARSSATERRMQEQRHVAPSDPARSRQRRGSTTSRASGRPTRCTRWRAGMRTERGNAYALRDSARRLTWSALRGLGRCRGRRPARRRACAAATACRSGCRTGSRASSSCWPARATATSATRRCTRTTRSRRSSRCCRASSAARCSRSPARARMRRRPTSSRSAASSGHMKRVYALPALRSGRGDAAGRRRPMPMPAQPRASRCRRPARTPTRSSTSPSPAARPARPRASCTATTRCWPTAARWWRTGATNEQHRAADAEPDEPPHRHRGAGAGAGGGLRAGHARPVGGRRAARLDRGDRRDLRDGRAHPRDGPAARGRQARARRGSARSRSSTWPARRSRPRSARRLLALGVKPQNVYGMTENGSHQYTQADRPGRGHHRHLRQGLQRLRGPPVEAGQPGPGGRAGRGRRDRRPRRRADARLLQQPVRHRELVQQQRLVPERRPRAVRRATATCRSSGARRT